MNDAGDWDWLTATAMFSTVSPFLALYLTVEADMVVVRIDLRDDPLTPR